MSPDTRLQHTIRLAFEHRVFFTRRVFDPDNPLLASLLKGDRPPARAVAFVDGGLLAIHPHLCDRLEAWFAANRSTVTLARPVVVLPGGERSKNEWAHVETVWNTILLGGICRHSYVLAIGGGAHLDLVGFGAATAHRGVNLIRLPTTSLSQGDGGVGVKNSVNRFGRKNWVGTFQVPSAVVNDTAFLDGLPPAELRGGLVEALKVALIRDRSRFAWMDARRTALAALDLPAIEAALRWSAELHVAHIATSGDPFELGSARPLDFGHWVAHKLEQLSDFAVGHGEAVAIGMAVDLDYAVRIGLLQRPACEAILGLMEALHFPLYSPLLDARGEAGRRTILDGLDEFREHLGGELTITLVEAIGQGREVHEMAPAEIDAAIDELRTRYGTP